MLNKNLKNNSNNNNNNNCLSFQISFADELE